MTFPRSSHKFLLSSITSTELRKITFLTKYMDDRDLFSRRMDAWVLIYKSLCRLVDWLRSPGNHHTLEVELRLTNIEDFPEEPNFTKFLPEFREKGVVTIKDHAHNDRVLYSSAHNR